MRYWCSRLDSSLLESRRALMLWKNSRKSPKSQGRESKAIVKRHDTTGYSASVLILVLVLVQ